MELPLAFHARGAAENPASRFDRLRYEFDPDIPPDELPDPKTVFLRDCTRSIIATNDSPDVGFAASINPYRGCEHGCIYCYARPYHEYLGFSAGLDFETKILVKEDAPELLRKELASPKWKPQNLGISGVTDCYQPIERKLQLTRRCLEVCLEFRNPIGIVTKNHLVTRDLDVLAELSRFHAAAVFISLTTLDDELKKVMEPRTTPWAGRVEAIRKLSAAGVPVGVLVAPVIPGLTDHEIPALLETARDAGAKRAGYVMLRLPHGLGPLFGQWLERHYPDKKEKVLGRIRQVRDGRLNDPQFNSRMRGRGVMADTIDRLFDMTCKRLGLNQEELQLSTEHFRRPGMAQGVLFC
jgi:DNA repair photolyase